MIISHKHKFIFIKLRKTAGTSLEIALSRYCDEGDIITPISKDDEGYRTSMGFSGPQNIHISQRHYDLRDWKKRILKGSRKNYYNHMPAMEIRASVPTKVWNNYYKFCFERNPWDKIISHYYHRSRAQSFESIKDYLLNNRGDSILGYDMYTIKGSIAVDKVFRYEEMPEALKKISTLLSLDPELSMPDYRAKSDFRRDKRTYREILTKEEAEYIAKKYAREIAFMGYSF